jgi:hypothetical protein
MQLGLGRLVDREGLDWWELTAIMFHDYLERLVLLRKLASSFPSNAEAWITRDGFEARALRMILGDRLRVMDVGARRARKGLRHYLERLHRLPVAQVMQTLGDKYDGGYRVRRHFHRREPRRSRPAVLVPSSYVNMSLTGSAYASVLPETDFLLVSTRASGRLRQSPSNVKQAWLASYASESRKNEYEEIHAQWMRLKPEISAIPELGALIELGFTDNFRNWFASSLAIRNAWLEILDAEPITAVLCCDDSNPHTHIPLLLASRRGLPTIACHHGALDGRHLLKTNHADVILAKGRMEVDYLVRTCGVEATQVEIGAPAAPMHADISASERDRIVFFSEPYEATSGRAEEIYRDTLPGLAELAQKNGKRLTLKLHPSENLRDRQRLVEKILNSNQRGGIEWLTGKLESALMRQTWFGTTVQSSVVTECVLYGVPCFICEWMDLWPYGYIAQFRKFGVGIGLGSPSEIATIPDRLTSQKPRREVADDCWHAIAPARFKELLAGQNATDTQVLQVRQS